MPLQNCVQEIVATERGRRARQYATTFDCQGADRGARTEHVNGAKALTFYIELASAGFFVAKNRLTVVATKRRRRKKISQEAAAGRLRDGKRAASKKRKCLGKPELCFALYV